MSDYFPLEVIAEILKRLPVKSLVKFMSVCKAWKSVITDNAFSISHRQRLQTNHANSSLFFHLNCNGDFRSDYKYYYKDPCCIQLRYEFYSLYSDGDATDSLAPFIFPPFYKSDLTWMVVGTCNGLVCFADCHNQVVLWNPSIHKYLILPKPSLTLETPCYEVIYGLGFDSRNHDFKVVRFVSSHYANTSFQVEIYSLAAHSWRSITVSPLPFYIARKESRFIDGVLHWLAYRRINGVIRYFILTFDVVEDKFGELMLPEGLESEQQMSILSGGNLLALNHMHYNPRIPIIWVMKEYGVVDSWTKLFHFDSTWEKDLLGWSGVSALRNNEELVLVGWHNKIVFLDPIKGLVKKIGHSCFFILFVGDHVESLFLINDKNAKTYC